VWLRRGEIELQHGASDRQLTMIDALADIPHQRPSRKWRMVWSTLAYGVAFTDSELWLARTCGRTQAPALRQRWRAPR
jgi:hypothetical protein